MGNIEKIINTAKLYIGQEEIQPNLGFKDPVFNSKMNSVGFYRSASWCAFFVMLVMKEIYQYTDIWKYLKSMLSPSTHTMWVNFYNNKNEIAKFTTSQVPKPGSIVIWQEGNGTNGHTGIVVSVDPGGNNFTSIEGNSNHDGSRNGYMVAQNTHILGLPHNIHGLNILGFVYMID